MQYIILPSKRPAGVGQREYVNSLIDAALRVDREGLIDDVTEMIMKLKRGGGDRYKRAVMMLRKRCRGGT